MKIYFRKLVSATFILPFFLLGVVTAQDENSGSQRIQVDVRQSKDRVPLTINLGSDRAVTDFIVENALNFDLSEREVDFTITRDQSDDLGMRHVKAQLLYDGVSVFGSEIMLHARDGLFTSMNGGVTAGLDLNTTPLLSPDQALEIAMRHSGGVLFRWDVEFEEALLKKVFKDKTRTWKPSPSLTIAPENGDFNAGTYRLAYDLILPVEQPRSANLRYFVDARTGDIVATWSRTPDADVTGSGVGEYHGTVTFQTNSVGASFELEDINRDVITYDGQSGTALPGLLYTDSDNVWNSANQAAGVDAHWAASKTYDYLCLMFWEGTVLMTMA